MNAGAGSAVLILVAASTAAAQSRPVLMPTRDVDITYRITKGAQTLEQRVRWLAAEQLERVDPPGAVYMIVDHKAHRLTLVDSSKRTVLEMELPSQGLLHPDEQAAYTKGRQDTVAGLGCTEWAAPADGGPPKQLCVTDDGVLLRIRAGAGAVLQATSVQYGRLAPETFQPPPGSQGAPPPAAAPPPPGTGPQPPE